MSDDMPTDEPIDEQFDESSDEQFDESSDEQFDEPITNDAPESAESVRPELARWELPGPTGVSAVDNALAPLVELDELPTGEHVAHYEAVHRRLQDALADLDSV